MNMKKILVIAVIILGFVSCGPSRKLDTLRSGGVTATLELSSEEKAQEERTIRQSKRDTIVVHDDKGSSYFIMKAVQSGEDGELSATEVLDAAVVTARSRSVAERHGMVEICFEVRVPAAMQDKRWQLRFFPDMFIAEDSVRLEPLIITGSEYRRAQLRGYEQYERFLSRIISDTTRFIDIHQLEVFLERNIPELYAFKTDTTLVSDEQFLSFYGVSEQEAVDHYTNLIAVRMNEWRRSRMDKMYGRYIKVPIVSEGIRLDTVIRNTDGDFIYNYTQVVPARPRLRKIDIVLGGDIYESDRKLFSMTPTPPLTFYVSSLATFVDDSERYISRVVERRAEANTACHIDFQRGRSEIDISLGNNLKETERIRKNIIELLDNKKFDLDSIVISAWASPEGSARANDLLSAQRAASVAGYFDQVMREYRDSLAEALGFVISEDSEVTVPSHGAGLSFLSRSNGENWGMLSMLVDRDTVLTGDDVRTYMRALSIKEVDQREASLRKEGFYDYMLEKLYPKLRTVNFDFYLHRKGMVKDTIHTTEIDSLYMKGVQALKDRNYEEALDILRPYRDYNSALALMAMDYNATAMNVLEDVERTPRIKYLMAILYARSGDDENAVQYYLDACREDRTLVFRGNLDPEIYVLIKRYGLDRQDEDE